MNDIAADEIALANQAWEAYYRAQATIARELADADIWEGLLVSEYAVLFALSVQPDPRRITELGDDVLLTQAGSSRLIARLEARGLVERIDDPVDGRARRIRLTSAGAAQQRRIAARVASRVAVALGRALDHDQVVTLRDLSLTLLDGAPGPTAEVQRHAMRRTLR